MKYLFTKQEVFLILSALELWQEMNNSENETMGKEGQIKKLIQKVRLYHAL